MSESTYELTPVGRFVQGDCFAGSDKDHQGNQRRDQQGNPKIQWFVGLAIQKGPEFDTFWAKVQAKAQLDFPQGDWGQPGFAWKCEDGDAAKHVGKDGFANSWVLKLTSGYAPKVFFGIGQATPQAIVDPNQVRRGAYLQVEVGICGNSQKPAAAGGKPGMYLNLGRVLLVGYGPEISSAPPVEEVFKNRGALPPGASTTPMAAAPVQPGQALPAGTVVPAQAPLPAGGVVPGPPQAVAVQPGAPVAPQPGFLQPTAAPAPAAQPAAAPAMPGQPVPQIDPSTGLPY